MTLKKITRLDQARSKAHGAYNKASGKAGNAWSNATSKPGARKTEGGKFGRMHDDQKETRALWRLDNSMAALTGGTIGASAGAISGGMAGERHKQIERNKRTIARNNKKLGEVGKRMPRHLITDLGTKPGKFDNKVNHPGYYGLGGMAVGAGAITPIAQKNRRDQKKTLKNQQAQIKEQRDSLRQVRKDAGMSLSAFGVDHGEVSKAKPKEEASLNRKVLGTAFGPLHGAVAGKGAKGKAKSVGTQVGAGLAGGAAGAAVGAALTRGRSLQTMGNLTSVGGYGGQYGATQISHNKGWLKREQKS